MALMTRLSKDRHGTCYFRRVIPEDLQRFMPDPRQGKANRKRSLKTLARHRPGALEASRPAAGHASVAPGRASLARSGAPVCPLAS